MKGGGVVRFLGLWVELLIWSPVSTETGRLTALHFKSLPGMPSPASPSVGTAIEDGRPRVESKVLIKGHSLIVLGVHDECIDGRRSLQRPTCGINQKRSAQPAAVKLLVNRKTPDANSGHGGIARQTLRLFRGKVDQREARCSDRVIPRHSSARGIYRNETMRDASTDVLSGLRLEIAIQGFFSAVKRATVVFGAERRKAERGFRHPL